MARIHYDLRTLAWKCGDLAKAEGHLAQALGIQRKLNPVSEDVLKTATSLGGVLHARGNLAEAVE